MPCCFTLWATHAPDDFCFPVDMQREAEEDPDLGWSDNAMPEGWMERGGDGGAAAVPMEVPEAPVEHGGGGAADGQEGLPEAQMEDGDGGALAQAGGLASPEPEDDEHLLDYKEGEGEGEEGEEGEEEGEDEDEDM